ncbi:MAG TPA: RNA polymerase sigma-70 factor [Flavisolibacter sp.]|nr:RNA polymerase sigma-70 factor [Flavisolibacter sp.]
MLISDRYHRFEEVFREHYNSLANYALSILRNEHDAEDVVQEVFIRVWQNNPEVIATAEARYYLITATRNAAISHLRKQAGRQFVDPETAGLQHQAPEEAGNSHADPMDLAAKALQTLPPQCRLIFTMSRFGQLTYQQIAEELGLSVKTVDNQVGKALRLMRDYARRHRAGLLLLACMALCCLL